MSNRALLIGINQYPSPNQLSGCINDIGDMANFLITACKFQKSEITMLADGRATASSILSSIDRLISGAVSGDRLFLHYSGHGAQITFDNVLHDALCPVDWDWSRSRAILDVDLRDKFSKIPAGVEFIFLSDSCHSGDLTREMSQNTVRSMQHPVDILWNISSAVERGLTPLTISKAVAVHDNCGFISGCASNQTSADASFSHRPNGAATFFILNELKKPTGLTEPLTILTRNICSSLSHFGYSQQPQLHGPDVITSKAFLSSLT